MTSSVGEDSADTRAALSFAARIDRALRRIVRKRSSRAHHAVPTIRDYDRMSSARLLVSWPASAAMPSAGMPTSGPHAKFS